MSTAQYLGTLAAIFGLCVALLLGTGCGGSSPPPNDALTAIVVAQCNVEAVRRGATPEQASAICEVGGQAFRELLAELQRQAMARMSGVSVASLPCGDAPAPAPLPPIPTGAGGGAGKDGG